ncbi:hypothetical protein F3Y22_tig00002919pilonHSYRG00325 [Hibiscus syriacus]|uniref:Uncharacterized protein n=1 Tax=Hibiscus syriacus TaxID=106335 RepID=A0A6A3CMM8_HIBSY|nr:uncharacterized protein LOC120165843 [Hibiscus syriacus]KAE8730660.1 hypothetical protein F3Y22_tig00002919pilonHSYRG00325 [Hibiscus syriacus]
MPFPMKIQPIDFSPSEEVAPPRLETVKPVVKSRLKRLFERPFPSVPRNSAAEKVDAVAADELPFTKECTAEFEPNSVCLAKMVQNFIEENNEKHQSGAVRCNRNRPNCFNRNRNESSEDEMDSFGFSDSNLTSSAETSEVLKSLIPCGSVNERNLLAHTAKIMEKNKISKRKDDYCRKIVTDGLLAVGYDASICKSRWEKSPSYPAGEYEYIDVMIDGERLLIDIDFRSEFEIARSTKTYKSILQMLPFIFIGKADRLQRIIAIVSEAAKQSLRKKGLHVPPWRKAEYVSAKWLSPYNRATPSPALALTSTTTPTIGTLKGSEFDAKTKDKDQPIIELISNDKNSVGDAELGESIFFLSESSEDEGEQKEEKEEWKSPETKPRSLQTGIKIVTGLASVIEDGPREF